MFLNEGQGHPNWYKNVELCDLYHHTNFQRSHPENVRIQANVKVFGFFFMGGGGGGSLGVLVFAFCFCIVLFYFQRNYVSTVLCRENLSDKITWCQTNKSQLYSKFHLNQLKFVK